MKASLFAAFLGLTVIASPQGSAQPTRQPSPSQPSPPGHRVSVVVGSVVVPPGSISYRTGGSVDYFLGHIQISQPSVRILYAVGMVGRRPNGSHAKGYRWLKQEALPSGTPLTYGERHQDGNRLIEANVGMANFCIVRTSESDVAAFLAIVRTYGPCQSCPQPIHIGGAT